ncbi:hypothetical protein [Wolbachia endosymbiont (group A) of Pogonocherus hispidulus]|uniref:hypothetical protein n=1 Tax=Wolbachia endosymbiont (group A) of Pogonocherus hispidulus TaxID=3066136 RepID=UPI00333F60E7
MSSKFFTSADYLNNGYNVCTAMYIVLEPKKEPSSLATWMTEGSTRSLLALVYLNEI